MKLAPGEEGKLQIGDYSLRYIDFKEELLTKPQKDRLIKKEYSLSLDFTIEFPFIGQKVDLEINGQIYEGEVVEIKGQDVNIQLRGHKK